MTSTRERLIEIHSYLFDELSHPTTKDWFLSPSPIPLLIILVAYNILCSKIGPLLMKNRAPYELKTAIKCYNIFQVILSTYIAYECSIYMFFGNFNLNCEGVPENNHRVAHLVQVYFLTKIVELLDTVFFVLRKSDRQITFLHLYHHTLMPIVSWIAYKYVPGGQCVVIGMVNSYIHVVMYTYYLLSGLGPQYQKYLWWKKYLTVMQIVQFTIILLHSTNSLFYTCNYPVVFKILAMIEALTFIYLFSKFYYYSYLIKGKKKLDTNGFSRINIQAVRSAQSAGNGQPVRNGQSTSKGRTDSKTKTVSKRYYVNGDRKDGDSFKISPIINGELNHGIKEHNDYETNIKSKHA